MIIKEFKYFNAVGFQIDDNHYIYDTNTNHILRVDKIVVDLLDFTFEMANDAIINQFQQLYSLDELKNALTNIEESKRKHNLFSSFKIEKMSISDQKSTLEEVKEKLSNDLTQLIINVTEECNFRCEYCIYSGSYSNKRTHNKVSNISFETAKSAIDFFTQNSKRSEKRYLSFFGGEPLLKFDLIKKLIEYAVTLAPNFGFSVTTNGSLLNEEMISFFSKHDIHITISLDGPKEIHDKHRKYANGKATFDSVMERLKYIQKNYPDFFKSRIRYNAVVVPHDGNPQILNQFFSDTELFSFDADDSRMLSLGLLNPLENTFVDKGKYLKFFQNFHQSMCDVYQQYLLEERDLLELPASISYFFKSLKRLHCRPTKNLQDYNLYWPNGICIPGMRSLFVTGKGKLYPCEKLYDFDEMPLGNIHDGFDFNRIANYIDDYIQMGINNCSKCWALRFCGICFVQCRNNNEYNLTMRREYCNAHKKMLLSYIELYCSTRGKKADAFKYLDLKENKEIICDPEMIED